MHVTVVELLRCPAPHAESSLVATSTRQLERRILEGSLGCPVCGATYEISAGIADFQAAAARAAAAAPPNDESVMRLAAQLDLTEAGRLVLLFGDYARLAPPLSLMFDAQCIAVNAPSDVEPHVARHASVLRISRVIPLAPASLRAAAIDAPHVERFGLDSALGLLRPRGRLVAPASVPVPESVELLARDEREWVAARTPERVQLRRA